jgi:signal recognition particle subunit SRP68
LVVLQAKTIYEQLSSTLSEEESALYRGRIDEIIPSLRYCAYNIGDASARQDLLNMSRGSNFKVHS